MERISATDQPFKLGQRARIADPPQGPNDFEIAGAVRLPERPGSDHLQERRDGFGPPMLARQPHGGHRFAPDGRTQGPEQTFGGLVSAHDQHRRESIRPHLIVRMGQERAQDRKIRGTAISPVEMERLPDNARFPFRQPLAHLLGRRLTQLGEELGQPSAADREIAANIVVDKRLDRWTTQRPEKSRRAAGASRSGQIPPDGALDEPRLPERCERVPGGSGGGTVHARRQPLQDAERPVQPLVFPRRQEGRRAAGQSPSKSGEVVRLEIAIQESRQEIANPDQGPVRIQGGLEIGRQRFAPVVAGEDVRSFPLRLRVGRNRGSRGPAETIEHLSIFEIHIACLALLGEERLKLVEDLVLFPPRCPARLGRPGRTFEG